MSEPFNPWKMPGGPEEQPEQQVTPESMPAPTGEPVAMPAPTGEPVSMPVPSDAPTTADLPPTPQTPVAHEAAEEPASDVIAPDAPEVEVTPADVSPQTPVAPETTGEATENNSDSIETPDLPAASESADTADAHTSAPAASPETPQGAPTEHAPVSAFAPPSGTPTTPTVPVVPEAEVQPFAAPQEPQQVPDTSAPAAPANAMPYAPNQTTPMSGMPTPQDATQTLPGVAPAAPPMLGTPGGSYPSAPYGAMAVAPTQGSAAMAIAALILGILALLTAFIPFISFLAFILALIGAVLGTISVIRQRPGKGFAIGGIATSAIALLVSAAVSIVTIVGLNALNNAELYVPDAEHGHTHDNAENNDAHQDGKAHDEETPSFDDFVRAEEEFLHEIQNHPNRIRFGSETREIPASLDKESAVADLIASLGQSTAEGSWDNPAKTGQAVITDEAVITLTAVNTNADSEITDSFYKNRLDGTNKYISIEFAMKNYHSAQDDEFVFFSPQVADSTGKTYWSEAIDGKVGVFDQENLKAGETITGKAYYLVPKDTELRLVVENFLPYIPEIKDPPSVFFFEVK